MVFPDSFLKISKHIYILIVYKYEIINRGVYKSVITVMQIIYVLQFLHQKSYIDLIDATFHRFVFKVITS